MQVALMQQKFKILSHSIDQLKQEIISKDQKLVKENFAHHRVENEIQTLRNDLTRIKKQIQSSEQIINNQISEIRKLSKIIADADAERLRQRKEYDAVIAERDMLGTQLIRRNNEVKALYEKIKIARSTLTKGEWTFEERMEEHTYLVDMIEEAREQACLFVQAWWDWRACRGRVTTNIILAPVLMYAPFPHCSRAKNFAKTRTLWRPWTTWNV